MTSVYRAPLVILAMVSPLSDWSADLSNSETLEHNALRHQSARWEFDLSAFSLLLSLAVANERLGIFRFRVERAAALREAFAIPQEYDAVGAILVGYPLPVNQVPEIRPTHGQQMQDVHLGRWGVHPN
jgi:hypothetical protein